MKTLPSIVRGPILNPRRDGGVDFIADGILAGDENGKITYVGSAAGFADTSRARRAGGIICPPFVDAHIHIPQHPIRGKFMDGVGLAPPGGRLLAGLERNVFPAEGRCAIDDYTAATVEAFRRDTLAHGVVGGAAYMTVHAAATKQALEHLPATWQVGMVLMNQNCPPYLRTDEEHLERDVENLAAFGERCIVTDRFAVAVNSQLRRRAVELAKNLSLRMQTHLNEQIGEKRFVEQSLYPDSKSYTHVYHRDGLLDRRPILAHCIHMRDDEFERVAQTSAVIAHCPTSNTLLGSGVMPLDKVIDRGIDYAICTDVGASPTTSILNEMAQFLKAHAGRSHRATPQEALYRTTFAAARVLGLDDELGRFDIGRPMSFIEITSSRAVSPGESADDVIRGHLLEMSGDDLHRHRPRFDELERHGLDTGPALSELERDVADTAARLDQKIARVVLNGRDAWSRDGVR